ncbi:hypothetical protein HDC92_001004 [Pedobacter sp. AK017]|uniref:RagB/SusD family nutrient uptake outer membrane protein n=1 Tax=Pedobacter sp. AK017 TaxID=2723073 RepID=UPI00160E499F|nr:RagB/SusD family nutrient uptake outer membrane protein [Pedobacter sp. AK017]MBB5437336.1 hypothetical protein [Pedobacter sp. AK017]
MKNFILLFLAVFSVTLISCEKFLDKKSDISLNTPSTLEDYQKLMDYGSITTASTAAALGTLGADEYYFVPSISSSVNYLYRNSSIWAEDIFEGNTNADWKTYSVIYISNVVLDGLKNFKPASSAEEEQKKKIMGHALFVRAYTHYYLEEIFGKPYIPNTANLDLGVPLRLTANLEEKSKRSTVGVVYTQILDDLNEALVLLPDYNSPINRPSKTTVNAMLSRVYLTMQNYPRSKEYSDATLKVANTIYDYNKLVATATRPFAAVSPKQDFVEILYPAYQSTYGTISGTTISINTDLYNSYSDNDLRKSVFFAKNATLGTYYFKGQYSGNVSFINGPFIDEILLNRAECSVRSGDLISALKDMDDLLIKRYKTGTYVPFVTTDKDLALKYVLDERKKELVFRGTRWTDLRRLNQDPKTSIVQRRSSATQLYELLPNDKRYTYPIPLDEIQLSVIEQNDR